MVFLKSHICYLYVKKWDAFLPLGKTVFDIRQKVDPQTDLSKLLGSMQRFFHSIAAGTVFDFFKNVIYEHFSEV